MRIAALGLVVLVGCAAGTEVDEPAPRLGRHQGPLAVTADRWSTRTIPLAWGLAWSQKYDNHPTGFSNALRDGVEETWALESALAFIGYFARSDSPSNLRLLTSSDRFYGARAVGGRVGATSDDVFLISYPVEERPPEPLPAPYRTVAARAVGLGLGILPEDKRTDGVDCGSGTYVATPATYVGAFDYPSVMSPCGDASAPVRPLSASDVDGVQRFYGPSQPFAATAVGSGMTFVFARGADNTLVQNWFDGSAWRWTSHGGILGGSPTVLRMNGQAHVFVRDHAGALVERYWDGANGWQWRSHGTPGTTLMGTPSAVLDSSGRAHVVIRGADHSLYDRQQNGTSWGWTKIGAGPVASDPEVVLHSNVVRVFAKGIAIGQLVTARRDGTTWSSAVLDGMSIRSQPRAVVDGAVTRVFYRKLDDSLFQVDFPLAGWNVSVTAHGGGMRGTPSVSSPTSIFVRGTDDQLWERSLTGSLWQWTRHTGPTITASPTATAVDGTRRVFVRNTAGGLDENFLVGSTAVWGTHPGGALP